MTPEEIAMKLASASAQCGNGKCPYTSECKNTHETCKMKEVALVIRALLAELSKLRAEHEALKGGAVIMSGYLHELEKINAQYYRIISQFQQGYRQKAKVKKRVPHIGSARGRRQKDPLKMDGDERYAMPEEPKEPKPQAVII